MSDQRMRLVRVDGQMYVLVGDVVDRQVYKSLGMSRPFPGQGWPEPREDEVVVKFLGLGLCSKVKDEAIIDQVVSNPSLVSGWTKAWPMEPGIYWFHGWMYGNCGPAPRLPETVLVKVSYLGKVLMSVCDGAFVYPPRGYTSDAVGMFLKTDYPEPPVL